MKSAANFFSLTIILSLAALGGCSRDRPEGNSGVASEPSAGARKSSQAAVRETYLRSCHSCHGSGVGGAPRSGDANAWAPRLAKGMDTLVANAVNGYRAMPPRGLCFDCSEAEFAALIQYMANAESIPE